MSFGGLFRRIEQSVLQSVGAVESSLSNPEYTEDDTRLDRLDATLKALNEQQQNYQQACRRSSETALHYAISLERTLTTLSSASTAPHQLDLKPLLRLLSAQKSAVSQVNDQYLGMGMRRVGALMKEAGALRVEFGVRKERVTDFDSYVRRRVQADQALAATTETVKKVEAREALRKAEGKEKDSAAMVAQMSSRIRARLSSLEVSVTAEATECALALLALQVHAGVHAAESSSALLPTYPGAAHYMCELAAATAEKAQSLILSMGGGGDKKGGGASSSSSSPSSSAHDALYASMAAALRSPYTVEGSTGGMTIDAAPFAVLHAGACAPSSKLPPSTFAIDIRPPGNPPGPAAAPASRLAATSGGGSSSGGGGGRGAGAGAGAGATPSVLSPTPGLVGDEGEKSDWVRVSFNYTPSQLDELALVEGSKVYVLEWAAGGDENWVRGRNSKGEEGVFPANYVKVLTMGEVRASGLPLALPSAAIALPSTITPTASSAVGEGEGEVQTLIDFAPIAPSNPTPPPPTVTAAAAAAAATAPVVPEVAQPPPLLAAVESTQSSSPTFEGGAFDFA